MKHVLTDPSIRILKVANCPSLSGKSTLTYHIGCNGQSDIQFRIVNNTGGGFFSKEWVPLNTIFQAFDKKAVDKPIVSLLQLHSDGCHELRDTLQPETAALNVSL